MGTVSSYSEEGLLKFKAAVKKRMAKVNTAFKSEGISFTKHKSTLIDRGTEKRPRRRRESMT